MTGGRSPVPSRRAAPQALRRADQARPRHSDRSDPRLRQMKICTSRKRARPRAAQNKSPRTNPNTIEIKATIPITTTISGRPDRESTRVATEPSRSPTTGASLGSHAVSFTFTILTTPSAIIDYVGCRLNFGRSYEWPFDASTKTQADSSRGQPTCGNHRGTSAIYHNTHTPSFPNMRLILFTDRATDGCNSRADISGGA